MRRTHGPVDANGVVEASFEERLRLEWDNHRRVMLLPPGLRRLRAIGARENDDGSFELTYRNPAGAFYLLERRTLPTRFTSAASGALLGAVVFYEGPRPGSDYRGVEVTTPLALGCLHAFLVSSRPAATIRPRYRLSIQNIRQRLLATLTSLRSTTADRVAGAPSAAGPMIAGDLRVLDQLIHDLEHDRRLSYATLSNVQLLSRSGREALVPYAQALRRLEARRQGSGRG